MRSSTYYPCRMFGLVLLARKHSFILPNYRRTADSTTIAAKFDTVELNAPFYSWPKPATIKTWRRQARPGFIYSIKVNQVITHEKRFSRTRKLVRDFCTPCRKRSGPQQAACHVRLTKRQRRIRARYYLR